MMRPLGPLLSIAMLAGGLAACSSKGLTVYDASIPEAPPRVTALAGYLTIDNGTAQSRTLAGASAEAFERIEIHNTVYDKDTGLARMVRVEEIGIPPRERFVFQPGAYHLMLIHPKRVLKDGDSVPISLVYADGLRLTDCSRGNTE